MDLCAANLNNRPRAGFESEDAAAFPPYLMFDVINVCNARCTHCPQRHISSAPGFRPQLLSYAAFRKAIDECSSRNVSVIRLTADGEPLLHPDIHRFIRYARYKTDAKINLTTNASLLWGKMFHNIMESPPHVFDVSLDALSPRQYAMFRPGLDYRRVHKNIEMLLNYRHQRDFKVIVSAIRRPGMETEMAAFEAHWKKKADVVVIREMHTNLGMTGDLAIPDAVTRWPCPHLWQRLVIDYRETVRYCPVDWQGASVVGRLAETDLAAVWQGEVLTLLRSSHISGEFTASDVCRTCKDWVVTPWDKGWLRLIRNMHRPNP